MLTACYVAWNEAALIADSIRSVKAYVDRFVVVDSAFLTNPVPGLPGSTDGQREIVQRATAGCGLTYLEPSQRLSERDARNLALAQAPLHEWVLLMDGDELLVGDHTDVLRLLDDLPEAAGAVDLRVLTSAVLFNGMAVDVDEETYARAPVISTSGWQPRLVRNEEGLRWRGWPGGGLRRPGRAVIVGQPSDAAVILNRHVAQPFEGYQRDYAWESAQMGDLSTLAERSVAAR